MSNLALRLKRLWVDWCEHNKPDPDGTPWPAEAFLQWASHELRCELVAVLGDDAQCTLLRELAPHVQEQWPVPAGDHEHPTDPDNKRPSSMAPPLDTEPEDLLGPEPPFRALGHLQPIGRMPLPQQRVATDRPDLIQQGELKAGTTIDLTYYPTSFLRITWFEGSCTPYDLRALEKLTVTSIAVNLEEQLVEHVEVPFVFLLGEQNSGLMQFKAASPGDRIRIQIRNDSKLDLTLSIRLHGVEPVKERESA